MTSKATTCITLSGMTRTSAQQKLLGIALTSEECNLTRKMPVEASSMYYQPTPKQLHGLADVILVDWKCCKTFWELNDLQPVLHVPSKRIHKASW
eukprot:1747232-Amphidinium_carterae.1